MQPTQLPACTYLVVIQHGRMRRLRQRCGTGADVRSSHQMPSKHRAALYAPRRLRHVPLLPLLHRALVQTPAAVCGVLGIAAVEQRPMVVCWICCWLLLLFGVLLLEAHSGVQ